MKIQIVEQGCSAQAEILARCIAERIPAEFTEGGVKIALSIDPLVGSPESYLIRPTAEGWQIVGHDEAGVYYGVGKFLHTAKWSEQDFVPAPPDGVVTPACDFRAIYYSHHFFNWYQMAPVEEQERYLEDLRLWGYNVIVCIIPVVNLESYDEPMFANAVHDLRTVFSLGKRLGMKTGLIFGNQGLKTAPHEYDAEISFDLTLRGNYGRNLCPAKPDAVEYLRGVWRGPLEQFTDIGIDYVISWPYDEGGCGCADCRPWGARGYCELCKLHRDETVKLYPDAKFIVATWAFDATKDEGEYRGLYERLTTDMAWVDYLMVDAHGEYPRYPLEHTPIKPIINFPEISMWGLGPWGGFGANPLPERFQRIWDSSKHILGGGMPYTEGIYEDISKIQCMGYYWDPERNWRDILGEYINYEYSADVIDEVLEMMLLIERNHTLIAEFKAPDEAAAVRAAELADAVDARLPERARTAWRWRILYVRTQVDKKRYLLYAPKFDTHPRFPAWFQYYSGDLLLDDPEAQALFLELQKWYHCVPHNGENHHTLPPAGGTKLDVVV